MAVVDGLQGWRVGRRQMPCMTMFMLMILGGTVSFASPSNCWYPVPPGLSLGVRLGGGVALAMRAKALQEDLRSLSRSSGLFLFMYFSLYSWNPQQGWCVHVLPLCDALLGASSIKREKAFLGTDIIRG